MTKETDAIDRYLELMEKVVLNEINPENGARMNFLVQALTREPRRAYDKNQLIGQLVSIHRDDASVAEALAKRCLPRHWWTNTLGFPFSMISRERLNNVRVAASTVLRDNIEGAMIETGVWRGGACLMMKAVMTALGQSRPLYVCDSFEGLPNLESGPDSTLKLNENPLLTAPLDDVRSHFERLDLFDDDVHFVKGWFSDTMDNVAQEVRETGISVLRLDGDYYKSTIDVLQPLYPHVRPGGYVIIDDYNTYEQCRQATDEYREANAISEELRDIDGMAVYWRLGE